MQARRSLFRTLTVALTVGGISLSADASASGPLIASFGADHGQPAMANVYAIYFNPAAIAGTAGSLLTAEIGLSVRGLSYQRSAAALTPSQPGVRSDPNYAAANSYPAGTQATEVSVLAVPFAGFVLDLGIPNFRLGFASYIPFAATSTWSKSAGWSGNNQAPGAVDGTQRWHDINSKSSSLFHTVAAALRLPSANLSIGASVTVAVHSMQSTRAYNLDGSDDLHIANGSLAEGRSRLVATGTNLAAALGVYWTPQPDIAIGVSYMSQPGFGTMRLHGDLKLQPGNASASTDTAVDLLQAYPDVVRAGLVYQLAPHLDLRADGEWVRWSVFKQQCVVVSGGSCTDDPGGGPDARMIMPRGFRDSFGLRGGLGYHPHKDAELFGSGAVSTSPIRADRRDPSIFDAFQIRATIGALYSLTKHGAGTLPAFTVGTAATFTFYAPVNVDGESRLANYPGVARSPNADGTYRSVAILVQTNLTYAF